MPEHELIDLEGRSAADINRLLWEAGSLRHLMHASQQACYDKYRAWAAVDQDADDTPLEDGSLPRMFAMPIGRRWGKTSLCLWLKAEDCIRQPGSKHRYTSAFDNSIKSIVSDVQRHVFATAPEGCRPVYRGNRGPDGAGFYFPNGSVLYLRGLESNPDALRGQSCDGDVISEAAFIDKLLYTLTSVIYQQYQGEKHRWARVIVESSAPKDLLTDWAEYLLPDAKLRNAYFEATIRDNPMLSERQIAKWCSAMPGGIEGRDAQREYFNVIAGDPELHVIPEFSRDHHVVNVERPKNAYAVTSADPGLTHLFALVWGYYDFDNAQAVVESSWTGNNASTRRVACVCAAREYMLWGRLPPAELARVPLEGSGKIEGWRDLLHGDETEHLAEVMWAMASIPLDQRDDFATHPAKFAIEPQPGHFTYHDERIYKVNPSVRVSDVDLRFVRDVEEEYGLYFQATTKDSLKDVMVNLVRNWVGSGRLVFLPTAGPVIEHVQAGKWNKQRTRFDTHERYGHYDALAALIYFCRAMEQLANKRPHPPLKIEADMIRVPWAPRAPQDQLLQDVHKLMRGGHARPRMRSYRQ